MNDGKVDTYRCKVCGALKGDTNHWLIAGHDNDQDQHCLILIEWDEKSLQVGDTLTVNAPICGQRCAIVLTERWLSHRNFEPPQPNKVLGAPAPSKEQ